MSHEKVSKAVTRTDDIYHCDICKDPEQDGPRSTEDNDGDMLIFRTCIVCKQDFCRLCAVDHSPVRNRAALTVPEQHICAVMYQVMKYGEFVCDKCFHKMKVHQDIAWQMEAINEAIQNIQVWQTKKNETYEAVRKTLLDTAKGKG